MINLKKIVNLTLVMVLITSFWGCADMDADMSKNESSAYDYNTWGFIVVAGSEFYIRTDTKKTIKLSSFDNSELNAKEGDRVFASFSIINAKSSEATYDYAVRVLKIQLVNYGTITKVTEANKNTIADGIVEIKGVGITANNLNLDIVYHKLPSKKHDIILCYDKTKQRAGMPLILELKDNSAEDTGMTQPTQKLQSYNIKELTHLTSKNSQGKIKFMVLTNKGTSKQKEFNLVYTPQ